MNNEELDRHLYKFPDQDVLKNKLNIKDQVVLDRAERRLSFDRAIEGIPEGNFDLKHLQDIHHHLFQDIYEWAGEIRQIEFHKGGNMFMPSNRIEMGMHDVHNRLKAQNFLRDLPEEEFVKQAGVIIGDVNHIHPFREGNGRTQLQYLKQLGKQAGYNVDLTRFEKEEWIKASIQSHDGDYDRMGKCIQNAIGYQDREYEKRKAQILEKYKTELKDRFKENPDRSQSRDQDWDRGGR